MFQKANTLALLILALCLSLPLSAQDKNSKKEKWQEGKITKISGAPLTAPEGATLSGKTNDSTDHGQWLYTIEASPATGADAYIYEAWYRPTDNKQSKPRLALNGPVKFRVKKDVIYVVDEDKHEYKLRLMKSTLKREHH